MMKFGLLTSICEGMTFEEVVNFAAENSGMSGGSLLATGRRTEKICGCKPY